MFYEAAKASRRQRPANFSLCTRRLTFTSSRFLLLKNPGRLIRIPTQIVQNGPLKVPTTSDDKSGALTVYTSQFVVINRILPGSSSSNAISNPTSVYWIYRLIGMYSRCIHINADIEYQNASYCVAGIYLPAFPCRIFFNGKRRQSQKFRYNDFPHFIGVVYAQITFTSPNGLKRKFVPLRVSTYSRDSR